MTVTAAQLQNWMGELGTILGYAAQARDESQSAMQSMISAGESPVATYYIQVSDVQSVGAKAYTAIQSLMAELQDAANAISTSNSDASSSPPTSAVTLAQQSAAAQGAATSTSSGPSASDTATKNATDTSGAALTTTAPAASTSAATVTSGQAAAIGVGSGILGFLVGRYVR